MVPERAVLAALSPLAARHRARLAAMVCLGFLAALAEGVGLGLFIPLFYSLDPAGGVASASRLGEVLDRAQAPIPEQYRLAALAGAILLALLIKNALVYANGVLYSRAYMRIGHDLRMGIASGWLAAPLDRLEERDRGGLIDTLKTQTWFTIEALLHLVTLTIHVVTLLVFTALLFLLSWQLTLLVAASFLAFTTLTQFVTRRVKRLSEEGVALHERLSQQILDLVRGMRTIRVFGREGDELARFAASSEELGRVHLRRDYRAHLIQPLTETLVAILLLAVLLLAARETADIAAVLAFIVVLYRMYPHLKHADQLRFQLRDALGPVRATVAAALAQPDDAASASGAAAPPLARAITLDGVTFRYASGDAPALDDVSITIPAGATTAVVGPSGAGKSTLVHLLLRLFEPHAGRVLVDGAPLAACDAAAWRRRVAVVSQDVYLFNTTIRENIRYGRAEATDAEVEAAARLAHAHGFIERAPAGYETAVGDEGLRLSGGQRQRIALARALVRRPDLYILDEATNALDSLSEEAVREAIAALPPPHTLLVIAHRLASVRDADLVLVMDGGRVVQQGRFGDLLAAEGLFRRMYLAQHPDAQPSIAAASASERS
jgi:ATP-binding cassette, subfamily B, bacterial MsbA